jgi:hypothetical protein
MGIKEDCLEAAELVDSGQVSTAAWALCVVAADRDNQQISPAHKRFVEYFRSSPDQRLQYMEQLCNKKVQVLMLCFLAAMHGDE